MKHPAHIMVIYDGSENSVFEGQVVAPLLSYRTQHPHTPILLISFEKNKAPHIYQSLRERLAAHQISLVIARKYPLLSLVVLRLATGTVRRILAAYDQYTITARGPLAGYLCLQAQNSDACTSLKIQARGLLAAEYAYATRTAHRFTHWYHQYKISLFERIERQVYGSQNPHVTFEAVSSALKEYLRTTYGTQESHVSIAQNDIPPLLPAAQKQLWRSAIRAQLAIAETAHVYCYNGSAKAWQCPQHTIRYFHSRLQENSASFLLILTQEVAEFEKLCVAQHLPKTSYAILQVPHAQIYQFLAACDTGIIFRDPHIINWISRPTKILEYQAAGLVVVHNQTIGMLADAQANVPLTTTTRHSE